ncbi:MAG: threonine synthase, partial [Pseudomonadota bacterium]
NWARIAAQIGYFAAAQAALGPDRPLRFIVPSGNMGDALAGYVAAKCGLLTDPEIHCGVNANRTLAEVFKTGRLERSSAVATPSPAMDITAPSNFERVVYDLAGGNTDTTRRFYEAFLQAGSADLPGDVKSGLEASCLSASSVSNEETDHEMRRVLAETGWLICPHTAVGFSAATRLPVDDRPTIVLSTAHAAKFPETVERATGRRPELPAHCADLDARAEVFEQLPANLDDVRRKVLNLAEVPC